jgi:Rod binding domain-containing protein
MPQTLATLKKVAGDFETLFAQMFLSSMRKTAPQNPLLHGGRGEEIFTELLDSHYAESLSKRGKGLGIAEMIVRKFAAHVQAEEKGTVVDTNPPFALPSDPVGSPAAKDTGVNRHD